MDFKALALNKYFYIGLIIFFAGFYYFGGSVFSFTRLGLFASRQNVLIGNEYIRKSDVDDTAIGVVLASIKFGKSDYNDKYYLNKAMQSLSSAKTLVNTDTIELLDSSPNKSQALESHVSQMEKVSSQMDDIYSTLSEMGNEKKSESVQCQAEKSAADTNFFAGVRDNEQDMVLDGLSESMQNGPCYISGRILSNAYLIVADKTNFYKKILDQKVMLLQNNQDMILQNYELFSNSKLETLTSLRNALASYKISDGALE